MVAEDRNVVKRRGWEKKWPTFFIAAWQRSRWISGDEVLAFVNLSFNTVVMGDPRVLEWRLTRNVRHGVGIFSGHALAVVLLRSLRSGQCGLRYAASDDDLFMGCHASWRAAFWATCWDRLLFGFVLDMVYFPWMPWYVCNFADIAIAPGGDAGDQPVVAAAGLGVGKTEAKAREAHEPYGGA